MQSYQRQYLAGQWFFTPTNFTLSKRLSVLCDARWRTTEINGGWGYAAWQGGGGRGGGGGGDRSRGGEICHLLFSRFNVVSYQAKSIHIYGNHHPTKKVKKESRKKFSFLLFFVLCWKRSVNLRSLFDCLIIWSDWRVRGGRVSLNTNACRMAIGQYSQCILHRIGLLVKLREADFFLVYIILSWNALFW